MNKTRVRRKKKRCGGAHGLEYTIGCMQKYTVKRRSLKKAESWSRYGIKMAASLEKTEVQNNKTCRIGDIGQVARL